MLPHQRARLCTIRLLFMLHGLALIPLLCCTPGTAAFMSTFPGHVARSQVVQPMWTPLSAKRAVFLRSSKRSASSRKIVRCLAPIDSEIDWVDRMVYHVKNWPSTFGTALLRRWEERITVNRDSEKAHFLGAALAQGEREYMEDMAFAVSHVPVRVRKSWKHHRSQEHQYADGEPEGRRAGVEKRRVGALLGVGPCVVAPADKAASEPDELGEEDFRTADVSFFSIIDGHNGDSAALWTKKFLWNYVKSELKRGAHPREALRAGFLRTDITFTQQASAGKPPDEAGAAVIALLVLDSEVFVGGAGDARAILCNTQEKPPLPVSVTHRPDVPKEKARILSRGGNVTTVGSARISGVLSVSRGIGDLPHKKFLSAEPDVVSVKLREEDRYMVLGSDGVWDYLSEHTVDKLLKDCRNARVAAETVSTSALFAGSDDNVGCLVVDLPLLFETAPGKENVTATEEVPSLA